jgi:hypothetical protein
MEAVEPAGRAVSLYKEIIEHGQSSRTIRRDYAVALMLRSQALASGDAAESLRCRRRATVLLTALLEEVAAGEQAGVEQLLERAQSGQPSSRPITAP